MNSSKGKISARLSFRTLHKTNAKNMHLLDAIKLRHRAYVVIITALLVMPFCT